MKTIEERAKNWCYYHSIYLPINPALPSYYEKAYEQGAKEQREIDIEKACEFLNKFLTDNKMKTILISELRKAMEEE